MNLKVFFSKKTLAVFCFIIFVYFFVPTIHSDLNQAVLAQTNSLRINVIPQFPGPFENVTIDVEDFSRNLNNTDITWSVGGKTMQKGIGQKRFQTKTGALGTITNVSINMGGEVRQLNLRPATIDLMWQADTFTPPFYKGKALHSNQDPITVVAEPFFITSQGVRLDPEKLTYTWKQNAKVNSMASGYGKKVFKITPSVLLKPVEVQVEVSSSDGVFRSASTINIPDSKTDILLYENHPLYGVLFNKTLNNSSFAISEQEVRILGVPLFFSNQQKNIRQLFYSWKLNNSLVNEQGNEVIFRKPQEGSGGKALVSLEVKNLERFTQIGNASMHVEFSASNQTQNSNNIF